MNQYVGWIGTLQKVWRNYPDDELLMAKLKEGLPHEDTVRKSTLIWTKEEVCKDLLGKLMDIDRYMADKTIKTLSITREDIIRALASLNWFQLPSNNSMFQWASRNRDMLMRIFENNKDRVISKNVILDQIKDTGMPDGFFSDIITALRKYIMNKDDGTVLRSVCQGKYLYCNGNDFDKIKAQFLREQASKKGE